MTRFCIKPGQTKTKAMDNDEIEAGEDLAGNGETAEDMAAPAESTGTGMIWYLSSGLVLGLAAFLRFFWLELRPLHHDEGVNGHFLTKLFREGIYHYDPSNYHGPDLYYLSLSFTKLFGLNTLSVRWSVAIFGFLTVLLALYLKNYLGKIGSLAAALFLALSPGMVFISRYFIHEILFVFLSLAIVVAVVMFFDKNKAGNGAVVWMTLLIAVCFVPVSLMGLARISGNNFYVIWSLRIGMLLVEAVLIFFVMRMLMNWKGGRPIYLLLASASAVLLYATKETAFITHGTMAIAIGCVFVWRKLLSIESLKKVKLTAVRVLTGLAAVSVIAGGLVFRDGLKSTYEWFYAMFSTGTASGQTWLFFSIMLLGVVTVVVFIAYVFNIDENTVQEGFEEPVGAGFVSDSWGKWDWILAGAASVWVFGYLLLLFFTSFFKYPGDFTNFFAAYAFWVKTGTADHIQSGYFGYVKWLAQIESPLIFLSVLGTLIAVIKGKHRFALFCGIWAFGLFIAYSIISYKTPWLALSFTLPMCLAGGYAVNELLNSRVKMQMVSGVVLSILAVVVFAFQSYDQNFVRYDDESMPYVYAHTRRGFTDLIRDAKRFADKSNKKKDSSIEVVSNEYWPMPWYFNDYKNANFHGQLVDANTSEIVIAHEKQLDELAERYSRHYKYIGKYPLRPGVDLYLLVRNDLAGKEGKNIYEIER